MALFTSLIRRLFLVAWTGELVAGLTGDVLSLALLVLHNDAQQETLLSLALLCVVTREDHGLAEVRWWGTLNRMRISPWLQANGPKAVPPILLTTVHVVMIFSCFHSFVLLITRYLSLSLSLSRRPLYAHVGA